MIVRLGESYKIPFYEIVALFKEFILLTEFTMSNFELSNFIQEIVLNFKRVLELIDFNKVYLI